MQFKCYHSTEPLPLIFLLICSAGGTHIYLSSRESKLINKRQDSFTIMKTPTFVIVNYFFFSLDNRRVTESHVFKIWTISTLDMILLIDRFNLNCVRMYKRTSKFCKSTSVNVVFFFFFSITKEFNTLLKRIHSILNCTVSSKRRFSYLSSYWLNTF